MKLYDMILELSNLQKIKIGDFLECIGIFEKIVRTERKRYADTSGLDDYKMRKDDYFILLKLYENTTTCAYKLEILLYYMYSYYKLDGFSFNKYKFPFKDFFDFVENNQNIHKLMLELINDKKLTT